MNTSKKLQRILFFIAVTGVMAGAGFWIGQFFMKKDSPSVTKTAEKYQKVYWNQLRDLNLKTGERTDKLESLNRQPIKIPGFVVPLDDNDHGLSEFLLVPSATACIHVPPPPPNQMIYVEMQSEKTPKREWGPIWLKGRLLIQDSTSGFGKVSYKMLADESEPFKY